MQDETQLRGQVARLIVLCGDAYKVLSDIEKTGCAVRFDHDDVMRRLADIVKPGGDQSWGLGDDFRTQCVDLLHRACRRLSVRWGAVLTLWSAAIVRSGATAFEARRRCSTAETR